MADPGTSRIAIIGEAPGSDEEDHGYPFVGASGKFLNGILAEHRISRNHCFIGNVCQYRPPGNKISYFPWDSDEIQSGLVQLQSDLDAVSPNICVLLGNTALHAAKANTPLLNRKGKASEDDPDADAKKYPFKISSWRGSLFRGALPNTPFFNRKCIGSLHPASVLREFSGYPLLKFDLLRAATESTSSDLVLPARELITTLDASDLIHLLNSWPSGQRCSVDIEGGLPHHLVNEGVKRDAKKRRHLGWRCVALSARPSRAFAIAWWKFSEDDAARIMQALACLMFRVDVPKVLQNSLYDNFVLSYGWKMPVRNVVEDTMLKGWEVYSELRKGLSTQASIWTREPHWKDEEMYESSGENLAVGCCKDTAVTLEICEAQDSALSGASLVHYRTNVSMLNPLLYMELRGIRYDQESVKAKLSETQAEIQTLGEAISVAAGRDLRGERGSLSSQRLAKCLYEEKSYPPQFKKEGGRKTDKFTTDIEALLSLRRKLPSDIFLSDILRHRHLEGLIETLNIKPDGDGRVRCGYNVVGTETGRLTCYTSPTGAGANLQTITKSLRYNYAADPGYDFFQCDLEGADGWTVAAHCARLGDRTMLDDYLAKMKPAKIIALLYYLGPIVNELDRESLKFHHDNSFPIVQKELGKWVYLGSKRVQHGSNYWMGIPTMIMNVVKDSFKESGDAIWLEHSVAAFLQRNYFGRYFGIADWHKWSESVLVSKGELVSASGQTRIFFGGRYGSRLHDTLKEFLAHEPQANTTYATNLAMLRLWSDPANRIVKRVANHLWSGDGTYHYIPEQDLNLYNRLGPGALIVEPLHQVHDALCGQWPKFVNQWARPKVKEWFNNTLRIADMDIVIPFDGTWGPNWGEMPNAL